MKRKLAAGVLSVILAISMMAGTFFTADGTDRVQAAEESQTSAPENRTWDLASDSTAVRPTLEKLQESLRVSPLMRKMGNLLLERVTHRSTKEQS